MSWPLTTFLVLFLHRLLAADFSYWTFSNETLGIRNLGDSDFVDCGGEIFQNTILRARDDNKALLRQTVIKPALLDVTPASGCAPSLRLTAARPFQIGAAWQTAEQPLDDGFDTTFYYQITNRSQVCEERADKDRFETERWFYCAAHGDNFVGEHVDTSEIGGDGFTFVVHNSKQGSLVMGRGGAGMGYEGIDNSIVIEFDTFANQDQGDPFYRHLSIHTAGPKANTLQYSSLTKFVKLESLSDSEVHAVRVVYFPTLRYDYLNAGILSSTARTRKYMGSRLGTLCVYHDNLTWPLLCTPLDLGETIELDGGTAFVGFTASTGLQYQNHDILNWTFSSAPPDL